ncbi:MAG: peptide-methionine (S)-S-oxide reductase MsrA [Acidobacteriota bacterium]|nr:peptide-methionine (S)-S-oxide reductase MsrA [Acidobacteriota bacterium]
MRSLFHVSYVPSRFLPFVAVALLAGVLLSGVACGGACPLGAAPANEEESQGTAVEEVAAENVEIATFAGGCFWCMEPPFEKLDGVMSVVSGYTGGEEENPTYKQVSYGRTGHAEAVQVTYDKTRVSYEDLLHVFWRSIDPTQVNGQFADRGTQYRTGIFYHSEEQKRLAEESKQELEENGPFDKPIVTEITEAGPFYEAEDYHQDFYKKNPVRYKSYARGSGRLGFLERTWGSEEEH